MRIRRLAAALAIANLALAAGFSALALTPARAELLIQVDKSTQLMTVTVDDALQGVTLVTRGADLFMPTHTHRLLQALLDLPVPRYRHHKLLTDASGKRFAKRDKALTLRALREAGRTPQEVRAMVEEG